MTTSAAVPGHQRFTVPEPMREFIHAGVAVVVGSADSRGRPHVTMAWGPRVSSDGTRLAVFLETARARQLLADVVENPMMAITVADPISCRSLQFKGKCTGTRLASAEEAAYVERHREAFTSVTALVGDPPQVIRNLYMSGETRRFEIEISAGFDQTPGPEAGKPL